MHKTSLLDVLHFAGNMHLLFLLYHPKKSLSTFYFFSLLNNLALALFRSVIRGSRCLPFLSNLEVRLLFKAFGLFFLKCSAVLCRALSWKVMLISPCFMLTICPRREWWQYIKTCLWHTVLGIIHYFFVKRCDSYCCRVAVSKFSYKQVGNF